MSALKTPRHVSRKHELREDTVVTFYARAWEFFDKNRKLVYGVIGGIVAVVLVILAYVFYQNRQQAQAVELLGSVVQLYEQGRYRDALDGVEGTAGLLEIADEYGSTDAGNLARFYAADALFRLGEYDRALEYFRKYDEDDGLIGASAIAGEAAIRENKGEYEAAGDLYRRAALHYENELRSPEYLLQAARAYERAQAYDDAEEALELITERFPESNIAQGIDFHLARLAAKRSS
ncbi:MAG TPA: tetratricopeptide repeat protein [Rhodothermales bacterium]